MQRSQIIRFSLALLAQLLLFGTLNRFDDWTLEQMPVRFVVTAIACGIAFVFAVVRFPASLSPSRQALLFWTVAVALRVLALPLTPGDDLWRYQWEGKIQHAGFNPYLHAPDGPQLDEVREQFPGWYKINHRDFRAIYPPAAELLFAGLSRISDSPLLYKILFTAADLAAVAVLLRLIGGTAHYGRAAWYAWNPLVVYSFAGAAHFDSLMILPMLAGALCLVRFEAATVSRTKWFLSFAAAAFFGIAISVKLIPALLLPICVFALGVRAISLVISVAIPALLSLAYGFPSAPIWESLNRFAYVTRLNDLFWWIIEETVWPNPRQKNYHYNVVIVAAVLVVSVLFFRNWRRGMLWVLGTALILTPVLHPWYCTWILPFAAWRRATPWQILSISLFSYFLFWNERLFALPWHSELWQR
ncbi:MAG: hypothetical protein M3Z22_07775, partial [Verrucomicrobiota bacterium]|nr:hypothetical protein [Verrucomicrobiota bacterium]